MKTNYPKTIKINGHVYYQQYAIENGMYYQTDDPYVSFIFASCIALHDDGRLTYLCNGMEWEWENAKVEF